VGAQLCARYRHELGHNRFEVRVRKVRGGVEGYLKAERDLHDQHLAHHRTPPRNGRVCDARGRTPEHPQARDYYVYTVRAVRRVLASRRRKTTNRTSAPTSPYKGRETCKGCGKPMNKGAGSQALGRPRQYHPKCRKGMK